MPTGHQAPRKAVTVLRTLDRIDAAASVLLAVGTGAYLVLKQLAIAQDSVAG